VTQINKYTYNQSPITSVVTEDGNKDYLWLGFELNDGVCKFKKVSANKPDLVYFDLDLAVTEIVKVFGYASYMYMAVNDSSIMGRRFGKTNPIALPVDFDIPSGVNEAPVDLVKNGSYICFLTPGNISGENAKIVRFTTAGVYYDTIELSTVTNAKALAVDEGTGEFWVITYQSPSEYIRVYQLSGGAWTYTINT